jgi:hypothetical protein
MISEQNSWPLIDPQYRGVPHNPHTPKTTTEHVLGAAPLQIGYIYLTKLYEYDSFG